MIRITAAYMKVVNSPVYCRPAVSRIWGGGGGQNESSDNVSYANQEIKESHFAVDSYMFRQFLANPTQTLY